MTNLLKNVLLLLAVCTAPQLIAQTYSDALVAMQFKDWDKAAGILDKLAKANPQDQDVWLSLGSVHMAKGEKDLAMKAYEGLSQNNGDGAKALVNNGRVSMLRNDMVEADKQFDKAARAGKKDASSFRQLGESFLYTAPNEKPNFTRALEFLKKGYDINSKDFDVLMSIGYAYKEQGKGGDAAQFYEYATMVEPKNPVPLYLLGRVYSIAKLLDKSIEYYDKAIKVTPTYTPALRARAEYYYFDAKNYDEATKAYKDIVQNSSAVTIEDEMQLANCLFLTKDYNSCITQVEKIVKEDNTKTYLRRLLAYCYYEIGDYQKGLDVINNYFKVVEQDKVLPSDYQYQANLLIKNGGDTLKAISSLRKVMELDAYAWALWKDIGDLYYKQKEYCNAAVAYQHRIDSLGEDAGSIDYYYLGICHYFCAEDTTLAKYEKALAAFTKITEKSVATPLGWFGQVSCVPT
ncbi:MAG: tetratricopeptide repeat protein [Lewinellaceae bacterium]|nr:tetratricopeptide repeat protein [Lewinellaceae bacterium]